MATERIGQESVVTMNSYLEVDVARWLSKNEIPYAYEPFTIPSTLSGAGRDKWDGMVEAIRGTGSGDDVEFTRLDGRSLERVEILDKWTRIYDKHRLQEEQVTVPVLESLSGFAKEFVLPDVTIYMGNGKELRGTDWDGWGNFDHILEIGGLYGVGIPDDSDEEEWFRWYRVSGVAFKELIYWMLGLWDVTTFVIPLETPIEGVTQGTPRELRDDEHYVTFRTTQAELKLGELGDRLGITTRSIEAELSPPIELISYERPSQGLPEEFTTQEFTYESLDFEAIPNDPNAVRVDDEWIVYHGELGEVFVTPDSVHVKESQFRNTNMILIREYVLDVIRQMEESEVVQGVTQVE